MLSQRVPHPPDRGDRISTFHLLRHFRESGARVRVGCLAEDDRDLEARLRTHLHRRFDRAQPPPEVVAAVRQVIATPPRRIALPALSRLLRTKAVSVRRSKIESDQ